jgi:biopolymer transport protein ExbB
MWDKVAYFFQVSGWTMYGIAACSVFALAVFFEKLWSLRRSKVVPRGLSVEVRELVKAGKISEASILCKKSDSPLSRVLATVFENAGKGRERVKELVSETGQRESAGLDRYMNVLNTTISVAPMLGFLGTVLGMVQLFTNVAQVGEVTNIGLIADGIYKALYTTIAGLTVSIPATLFYRYLASLIDRLTLELEEETLEVLDLLQERR